MRKILLIMMLSLLVFPVLSPSLPYPGERIEQVRFLFEKQLKEKEFELLIEKLGIRESGSRWWITNTIGCIGKWQFSQGTLAMLGYKNITAKKFKNDLAIFPEELQKKVLVTLFKFNEVLLKDYMYYVGMTIDGILITKSGMLAAAHLGGAGSVQTYLVSNGGKNNHDINNTSIKNYLSEFSGYDIN